jgi:hypothetical protein
VPHSSCLLLLLLLLLPHNFRWPLGLLLLLLLLVVVLVLCCIPAGTHRAAKGLWFVCYGELRL